MMTPMVSALKGQAYRSLVFMQSRRSYRAAMRWISGDVAITPASPADLEYVFSGLHPGVPYKIHTDDPVVSQLVAVQDTRVVGFVQLWHHPPEDASFVGFWLLDLHVLDPRSRGRGIGEKLVRSLIDVARDHGAREVWLFVGEKNRPAIALYQKLGFERAIVPGLEEVYERQVSVRGTRDITMVRRFPEETNGVTSHGDVVSSSTR